MAKGSSNNGGSDLAAQIAALAQGLAALQSQIQTPPATAAPVQKAAPVKAGRAAKAAAPSAVPDVGDSLQVLSVSETKLSANGKPFVTVSVACPSGRPTYFCYWL